MWKAVSTFILLVLIGLTQYVPSLQGNSFNEYAPEYAKKVKDAITPAHPTVRTFALRLAREFPGNYNIGQVCAIWYYLKKNWRYVNDPRGIEYFAPANESIDAKLSGDCDDFAILMASLIEAIGGSSRIILAFGPQGGHAYCEVCVGQNPQQVQTIINNIAKIHPNYRILDSLKTFLSGKGYSFSYHRGPDGYWLNLDWTAEHPGGPFFPATWGIVVYPDGRWGKM